jgi:hypothetical protein
MLVGALLGLAAAQARGSHPILDTTNHTSPLARCVLHVEPSDREGKGPGHYSCLRDGREVWTAELPFAFWNAAVTDEGIAVGVSYTNGPNDPDGEGVLVVTVLDDQGHPRSQQSFDRSLSKVRGRPSVPCATGIFAAPDQDRFVLRVIGETSASREEWWSFKLSDGSNLGRIVPSASVPALTSGGRIVCATHVPGTRWDLAEWRYGSNDDGVFVLLDPEGNAPWNYELRSDYAFPVNGSPEKRMREWIASCGPISVGPRPRTFELLSVAQKARIRFEVMEDRMPNVLAREIGREEYVLRFDGQDMSAWPEIPLTMIGEVRFDGGSIRTIAPQGPILVDSFGRTLLLGEHGLGVFSANGAHAFTCELDADEARMLPRFGGIAVSGSGEVLVSTRNGSWSRFDCAGKPLGREHIGSDSPASRCVLRPGTEDAWWFRADSSIGFYASLGREKPLSGKISKRPDGRWLRNVRVAAVAKDGTFAVLDEPDRQADVLVPHAICTYSADGQPIGTIELPEHASGMSIAILDRWFVLSGPGGIFFVGRDPSVDKSFRALTTLLGWPAFASPDGKELWVADQRFVGLSRYAIP